MSEEESIITTGFRVDRLVGTIIAAVFIWIGSNVHNMSIQMASMSQALSNNTQKVQTFEGKVNANEEKYERLVRDAEKLALSKIEALSAVVQTIQLEQGRMSGDVAKIGLLESQASQSRYDIAQMKDAVHRIETYISGLHKSAGNEP